MSDAAAQIIALSRRISAAEAEAARLEGKAEIKSELLLALNDAQRALSRLLRAASP